MVNNPAIIVKGLDNPELDEAIGDHVDELREAMELVQGAATEFDQDFLD